MELSKFKYFQRYMTSFELDLRRFEHQPQSNQISIILIPSMEVIFETLETADIDMNTSHSIIEPIFKRNFGNKFLYTPSHHLLK